MIKLLRRLFPPKRLTAGTRAEDEIRDEEKRQIEARIARLERELATVRRLQTIRGHRA